MRTGASCVVPAGVVKTTDCNPPACPSASDMDTTGAGSSPIVALSPAVSLPKFRPRTVTRAPPAAGPWFGSTDTISGPSYEKNAVCAQHRQRQHSLPHRTLWVVGNGGAHLIGCGAGFTLHRYNHVFTGSDSGRPEAFELAIVEH